MPTASTFASSSANSATTDGDECDFGGSNDPTVELSGDTNGDPIIVVIPPLPSPVSHGLYTNVEAIVAERRKGLQGDSGDVLTKRVKSVEIASQSDIHLIAWATTEHLMEICR